MTPTLRTDAIRLGRWILSPLAHTFALASNAIGEDELATAIASARARHLGSDVSDDEAIAVAHAIAKHEPAIARVSQSTRALSGGFVRLEGVNSGR